MKSILVNKLWKGVKIASLIGILSASKGDFTSKFDTLWGKIRDYNEARNELYSKFGKNFKEYSVKDEWQEVVDYSEENFPELIYLDNGIKEINQRKLRDLCLDHNKVIERMGKLSDPKTLAIVLGNVVEKSRDKKINFNGEPLEYKVILFEEEGKNIGDWAACWNVRTNELDINLTNKEDDAEIFFRMGSSPLVYESEFKDHMIKELYNAVMSEAKIKYPITYFFSEKLAFKKEFMPIAKELAEDHEVMHDFEYDPSASKEIKKASGNDTLSFLNEIRKHPKYNSYTFIISDKYDGRYSEFYKTFEDAGYSKEKLMKMKPEERSNVAKEIFDSFK